MADWSGVPLRRRLVSAECFSDWAMRRGLRHANTPGSRSSALLRSVTSADQYFLRAAAKLPFPGLASASDAGS